MFEAAAGDAIDAIRFEFRRLVHRRNLPDGCVIVLFIKEDDAVWSHHKIFRPNLALFLGARFEINEYNFENLAALHFRDACCHCSRSERDISFSDVLTPFGAAKFGRDRLIIFRIQKRIWREGRNGEQARHRGFASRRGFMGGS